MSSQTIARGEAGCQHPLDEPLVWKFNHGDSCYVCPRCMTILGYDVGSVTVTLRELRAMKRATV